MNLIEQLHELIPALKADIEAVASTSAAEEIYTKYLGRKGRLASLMSRLPELPHEERPVFGKEVNIVKEQLQTILENLLAQLKEKDEANKLQHFDASLPARMPWQGSLHPISLVMEEISEIFQELGFSVVRGPEVETDYYCFEALNLPKDHPARDMQDTLFIDENIVLRTHTSPLQIRAMLAQKTPPLAVIAPGKVYRRDSDVTHTPMFHQIEAMLIAENITLVHLRGILTAFVHALFGKDVKVRFRPSFFPFTEPGAEVDISCIICNGTGYTAPHTPCRVCKGTSWLEILGSGMVDPAVFASAGFSKECTGFAFGLGLERVAMLKYGISDLRTFFENDLRFLTQFS